MLRTVLIPCQTHFATVVLQAPPADAHCVSGGICKCRESANVCPYSMRLPSLDVICSCMLYMTASAMQSARPVSITSWQGAANGDLGSKCLACRHWEHLHYCSACMVLSCNALTSQTCDANMTPAGRKLDKHRQVSPWPACPCIPALSPRPAAALRSAPQSPPPPAPPRPS